nr:MAG TPA: hypothetical protein [Caudoviricetes sp.]
MRLSLKDYLFSENTSGGQVNKAYFNYRYNNLFLSTNYFKSKTFENDKKNNYFRGFTKEYLDRNIQNVIVKVDSNYLLSQKNEDGIITLEFENVDGLGKRVNTYRVEILFSIFKYYNTDEKYTASLEWININSDKPNKDIKYEVNIVNFGDFTDLKEYNLEEEINYSTEEMYKKYPENYSYDTHYDNTIPKISFENNIFLYKTGIVNERFYKIGTNVPFITIKAIGALATDTVKIYLKDITDFKKYYRQGCLFDNETFKGVNKLSKKLYVGTNEVPEDEINNSEKVDTGHVRLFKETNYKQAKYIESDNT